MTEGHPAVPVVPSRPRVALAGPSDVPILAAMRRTEGWSANEWLLNLLTTWSQVRVLLIRDAGEAGSDAEPTDHLAAVHGTTVATTYGTIGFIGNVIVDRSVRGRGLGKTLMAAALDWLKAIGVRVVILDATETGRPLYEQFGFIGMTHSWMVWQALGMLNLDAVEPTTGFTVARIEADEIGEVGALDSEAFGGDRMILLASMPGLAKARGYVAHAEEGVVDAYLFARPLDEPGGGLYIGPFIARSHEAARALLVSAMRSELAMIPAPARDEAHLALSVPGTSTRALDLYRSLGVSLIADDLRMRLEFAEDEGALVPAGEQHDGGAGRAEWLYGMLSTMVG